MTHQKGALTCPQMSANVLTVMNTHTNTMGAEKNTTAAQRPLFRAVARTRNVFRVSKHGVANNRGGAVVEAGLWCCCKSADLGIEEAIMRELHPDCVVALECNAAGRAYYENLSEIGEMQ